MADLSGFDPSSPTWAAIRAWAEEKLREAREAIEVEGLGPEQTAAERRAIRLLKELIDLSKPRPEIKSDRVPYC